MDLKTYLRVLRQHVALIIAAAVVGALGGLGVGLLTPTTYTAQTQLFVSIVNSGSATDLQQGSTFTQERMQTYVDMADSRAVLGPVVDDLGLDETSVDLAERVQATSDPNTVLIGIAVTDESPRAAARIAEAVATSLVDVVTTLENPDGEGASPVLLSVAEAAEPPVEPSSLTLWTDTLLGLLVGVVFGVGAALLRSALDTRLRGKETLRRVTRAPVLTAVPADASTARTPLVTDLPVHSPRGEAFRRLRTNLRYAQVGDASTSVLVTSSVAGEGKTTTSINLAIVMAQAGKRVALVDADLRRPRIAHRLGLENAAGLTTVLVGSAEASEVLQAWGDDELYVLTAGEIPPNPTELLESRQMSRLIAELTAEFDLVLIDGPPLLPVADGLVLSQQVGRVILVAGVGQVRVGEVQEALGTLSLVDANRVGVVLNKVPASTLDGGSYSRAYGSYLLPDEGSSGVLAGDPGGDSWSEDGRAYGRERGGRRGSYRGTDGGSDGGSDRGPERGPDRGPERGPDDRLDGRLSEHLDTVEMRRVGS
ncbi:polysaccharide biosynthesis tyrosine autokinase [Brevibacterium jeotgali]|uniref:Capsular exopolysaccharide family n=1 Tax=Brevibacterium jeotgali TaxID=1262550 RepID=A0A2H1L4R1_9MICO|nr:polysaccharide biosynthesis tyrosine autokinase [Brevibacterium jeotgali]TWC01638.1 capsular exopolysaccharide synthesis family protein [Brevibacterium jeotgali]SMY11383.1 capsular exopolysaccharide family [Brevibacterium jeotgali]